MRYQGVCQPVEGGQPEDGGQEGGEAFSVVQTEQGTLQKRENDLLENESTGLI